MSEQTVEILAQVIRNEEGTPEQIAQAQVQALAQQFVSESDQIAPLVQACRTAKQTNTAVEIAGLRIEPCDEHGETESIRQAKAQARAEMATEIQAILRQS